MSHPLDVHLGQRLKVKRGEREEHFVVESVTPEEVRLRSELFDLDFPTRVEAALWSGG